MKKFLLFGIFLALGAGFITSCNKCRQCEYAYKTDFDGDGFDNDEAITKADESCANSNDDLDDFESDFEQEVIDKEMQGDTIVSSLQCNAG